MGGMHEVPVATSERSELLLAGLTYRSTELDVRERHAIPRDDVPATCRALVQAGLAEAVLVSTCNRVQAIAVPGPTQTDDAAFAAIRAVLRTGQTPLTTQSGEPAVRQLFRLAGSLDSMVVGEPQILGQVKEAVELGREAGTVGPVLDAMFARAFRTAKRIRTETDIGKNAVSVGHVAVELARTIFSSLDDVSVLLVGAGKMGVLAARHLASQGAKKVLVTNRTFERGSRLASEHGWSASAYDDLPFLLTGVDVVICSTGSPVPVLTRDMVKSAMRQRRYRPLFLIDIAVPRDIDPGCGELDGVYRYDIDDLESTSRTNAQSRSGEVQRAEAIVDDELRTFARDRKERHAAPTIKRLREEAMALALAEAERTLGMLPGLEPKGQDAVRKLAEVIVGKLLRGPMLALRQGAHDADGVAIAPDEVARVLRATFALDPGGPHP